MDRRRDRKSGARYQERDSGALVLLAAYGGKGFLNLSWPSDAIRSGIAKLAGLAQKGYSS